MYLTHLSLTNFRNFTRLDVDVPKGALILVGANAQGKTSLLEFIYYLAALSSFHADSDRQVVNFLAGREPLAVARIVADYCRREAVHRLEVRVIQEANDAFNGTPRLRKEVLLDGVKRKASEVVGEFNAVLFVPQMMRIVEGGPEERRRYLNLALAQVLPRYAASLSDYTHAITQRNALLKLLGERGGDASQLQFWDERLSVAGGQIIYARIHALQELEALANDIHRELTHGGEVLRFSYLPAYDPLPQPGRQFILPLDAPLDRSGISLEKIQQGFLEGSARIRGEEIARGMTTIGPHRDELRFLGNRIDLGIYGSRGQGRTAMLALKLAEVAWMREKTGQWPVLLLDEVLAELDTRRRTDLLDHLSGCEQAVLATTDLDLFTPGFVQQAALWRIDAGRLQEEKSSPQINPDTQEH